MTVCIGAICDGGKAVVVAADRMMTYGPPMNLQAEGAVRKIIPLTDSAVLLFSGSVQDAEALQTGITNAVKHGNFTSSQISDLAASVYQNIKRKKVEDNILRPLLGIDFQQFQQLVSQSASSQILQQVLGMISQNNIGLDAILASVDDGIGNLVIITHPGQALLMNTVGTSAIGSGGMHAAVRLSLGRQANDLSIPETIFNVYEAKRASEVAPGVGKVTDIAVLKGKTITFVADSVIDLLGTIVKERPSLNADDLAKLRKAYEEATDDPDKK